MYKSTPLTFIFKYLLAPGIAVMMVFSLCLSPITMADNINIWFFIPLVFFIWMLCWALLLMLRLRSVVVTADGLTLKTLKGSRTIHYRHVHWVSEPSFVNPRMISMKYTDPDTDEQHKILIIPEFFFEYNAFLSSEEDEMTVFIRKQIITAQPEYARQNEPSRVWPIIIFIFSSFPLILVLLFLLFGLK